MPNTKKRGVCNTCGTPKPQGTRCKPCRNEYLRKRYAANPQLQVEASKRYESKYPQKRKERTKRYYEENRETLIAKARRTAVERKEAGYFVVYYAKNKEKYQMWSRLRSPEERQRQKANRRAAMYGAEGFFSAADIRRLWDKQKGRCATCAYEGQLTLDHIVSLKRGGTNWPRNLQLLCKTCNCAKRDLSPDEWAAHYAKRKSLLQNLPPK